MQPAFRKVHCRGWRLYLASDRIPAPDVIEAVLKFANGNCLPFRRSLHATTFLLNSPSGKPGADLFVKHLDPPAGKDRLKSWFRAARVSRTERATAALIAEGFCAAPIVLHGVHRQSRREVIVTARAEGDGPILALRGLNGSITTKRAVLRALGTELARFHRAGFIHGELTPFNLRILIDEPPRFTFIDNERTCRYPLIARRHRRLRNLVQLGHFALPGITRTDRMRVFRAYEAAFYRRHSRPLERKVAAMIRRRAARS
jgi:hypothetical protein